MSIPSRDELEKALSDAGSAHHEYEQVTLAGVRDQHWSGFYAAYALGRLADFITPSALSRWLEETQESDNWAAAAAINVLARLAGWPGTT